MTRLKTEKNSWFLIRVPGLCEEKSDKFLVLTFDGENGWALFKASHELLTNEGVIISKAETIIQKSLFQ